jgi:hypothetical protein
MRSVPGAALASMIAWRSEPAPLSAVVVTSKAAAGPAAARTSAAVSAPIREGNLTGRR